jgi:3-hydroxypropanoate dehydrogenase
MFDKVIQDMLFADARTHNFWSDKPVTDQLLQDLYDLLKWGPTAANCCPARFVFVKSAAAKARLVPCMSGANQAKVAQAPVTVIIGMDMEFHEQLPTLFPHADARTWFVGQPEKINETALRNASLQGAYLILAARLLGLDCGPMSGFEPDLVNAEFFAGTSHRVNFICSLGYGEVEKLHPRLPRLLFEMACRID